ncbi:MAG: DUF4412 domain-containing protein [Bacteroidetes bacterium]|nr:DUF4412 domain-containing protein [Bacteroidota bacterium]
MNYLKPFSILLAATTFQVTSLFAQAIPGMSADCNPKEVYKFDGSLTMKMSTYSSNHDTTHITAKSFISKTEKYMGMSMQGMAGMGEGGMNMVLDLKDSITYMLMEISGEKHGMCMDMNSPMVKAKVKEMKGDSSFDFTKYKKTGNTKKILGYNCEEFKYQDKNKTQIFWITKDGGDWWKAFNQVWNNDNGLVTAKGFEGMLLAMQMTDKKQNVNMNMEVTELNIDKPSEMSTKDYFKK